MRTLAALLTVLLLLPAESAEPCPLWNGHESIEAYARKVNLPPAKTVDLGNRVSL